MAGIRVLGVFICLLNVFVNSHVAEGGNDNPEAAFSYTIPERWQIPFYHYSVVFPLIKAVPELHNQKIIIRYSDLKTTMTVRPALYTIFNSRDNRTYIIRINKRVQYCGITYAAVPDYAKTGLWAHELMHIKDYKSRNLFGVLFRGWQYLSVKGKKRFEKEIDQMVINYGLGEYLKKWSYFVLNESEACPSYKEYKRKIYLNPDEIAE